MKDKKTGLPKKYFSGLSKSTAKARKAHWEKMKDLSDKDPKAYEPAPGDATAKTKESKYTKKYKEMFGESSDSALKAKAEKSGVSLGTLRKVYRRGFAAWKGGHRPGTTPHQWAHARVNSYLTKGKTYHTTDKDLREKVLEVGTDETLLFHKQMTPGEKSDVKFSKKDFPNKRGKTIGEIRESCSTSGCCCGTESREKTSSKENTNKQIAENSKRKKTKSSKSESGESKKRFQVKTAAPITSYFDSKSGAVPSGGVGLTAYNIGEDRIALEEAIQYHIENEIPFTRNVFRPGSQLFFEMIATAKEMYLQEEYVPEDDWERDLLESDICEYGLYGGNVVPLDFPFEESISEESDPTNGKGIGNPWQEDGGGAVYVKVGDSVRKINFSKSGMKKKYMDPGATKSFVARHNCLSNKDKTSASYWACRFPRYFSDSGKKWW